jgi:hypothetical protein
MRLKGGHMGGGDGRCSLGNEDPLLADTNVQD